MNCLYSAEEQAQNFKNKIVERQLQNFKRLYNRQIKLLLLGTNGSGKSTLMRQMRLNYDKKYEHRLQYIAIIHQNIFRAMQIMIDAMKVLNIPYENKKNSAVNTNLIRYAILNYPVIFLDVFLLALKELWADAGIQECFLRKREYNIMDSTKYFFNQLDRILVPNYIPTDEDILRSYVPSSGPQVHLFNHKNVDFLITEMSIQRSERLKWMHCFDNVTAIIYMVAMTEYDQFSLNSDRHNSLKDSMELLEAVAKHRSFQKTAIILVLNKLDLFEEKIMYSHLGDYFPEYKGPRYDPLAARNFLLKMLLNVIPRKRRIYYNFLSSIQVESDSFIFIYRVVRDAILNINLQYFNLI